jgi:hypothetical protein
MESVKPKAFFQLCEERELSKNPVLTFLPPSQIGSIRSIEAAVMVALIRLIDARLILEIGTYKGFTTSILAMNSHPDAVIYSVDLPRESFHYVTFNINEVLVDGNTNDKFLIEEQFRDEEVYCKLLDPEYYRKIRLLKVDSTKLDFGKILDSTEFFDLIFIDGGHDYKTALSDSSKALSTKGKQTVILWHDYDSSLHTEVSRVIEDLSAQYPIYAIAGTSFAIFLPEYLCNLLKNSSSGGAKDQRRT